MKASCPCCSFYTFPVPPTENARYICPVCFWENDPFTAGDDDPSDSNHGLTLQEARENFRRFGACEREMLGNVRPPRDDERAVQDNPPLPGKHLNSSVKR